MVIGGVITSMLVTLFVLPAPDAIVLRMTASRAADRG